MKYVCLVYLNESALQQLSQAEVDQLGLENWAFAEVYHDGGQLIVGRWLEPAQAAKTVRMRHGQVLTTGGPFAVTHEQLSDFSVIEAGDLSEAIRVASKMPSARLEASSCALSE